MTFIMVILVAISLPITVYIIKQGNIDLRINAFESDEPVQVQISDISNTGFKVSWLTERPVFGGVKLNKVVEPVMESTSSSYHSVTVRNLQPNSTYSFQLLSTDKSFTQTYNVTTASQGSQSANRWVLGQVFAKDGVSTQNGGLITLVLARGNARSQQLSTVINETGGFKFNIGGLLNEANSAAFDWNGDVDLTLLIFTEPGKDPATKVYTLNLNQEIQIPNIYLGDISIDIIPAGNGN